MKSYRGNSGDVFGVAIYQDKLISAGYDRIIRIFDLISCEIIKRFAGHIDLIRSLDVHKDPKRPLIVTGSWDRTIRVWDMDTGECLHILTGHSNRIKSVVVCEVISLGIILSGSDDTTMRTWDIITGHQISEFDGHSHCVLSIAASAELDPLAASGSTDTLVCVWNLLSGKHLFNLKGHESGVCALVFARPNADGQRPALISSSSDSSIRIWSMETGEQLHILTGHSFGIVALSMWQDKTVPYPYLMSCAQNGTLQIWDLHTLELKKTTKTRTTYLITIAQQSGDDNVMAFGGAEGYLRVQRTEEIYNASDIIGAIASPSRRKQQKANRTTGSQQRMRSRRIDSGLSVSGSMSVSRANSMESAGGLSPHGSFGASSFSFNDDESQLSGGSSLSPLGRADSSFQELSTADTFDASPKKISPAMMSSQLVPTYKIDDSLPTTPREDEVVSVYRGPSCDAMEPGTGISPKSPATDNDHAEEIQEDENEEEEDLSVCSFDARVMKLVIAEASEKSVPPSRQASVEEEAAAGLGHLPILGNADSADFDDVGSVLTELGAEESVFVNTESPNRGKQRFGNQSQTGGKSPSRQPAGGSMLNAAAGSGAGVMSPAPRISSAKWRHRGKHQPTQPISRGYGVGSRHSELKKKMTMRAVGSSNRGFPRIIEVSKPFILVTSLETETYTPMPTPAPQQGGYKSRQSKNSISNSNSSLSRQPPVQIRHKKPSTIVSSPHALPGINMAHNSHNGMHAYNSDDSLKTIDINSLDGDASQCLSVDFLDVSAKPPSPTMKKKPDRTRRKLE
jgi:WD40 repeat protein